MEQETDPEIMDSARTALVDRFAYSDSRIRPRIVFNNSSRSKDVRTTLIRELEDCDTYDISVAFITMSGIASLFNQLMAGNKRGRILTTDFNEFNDPKTFRELLKHSDHFEVRVGEQLHTKGYIFHRGDTHTVMVGSSNMTQYALKTNLEWNLRITSTDDGELVSDVMSEFDRMWDLATPLSEEWISDYEVRFNRESARRRTEEKSDDVEEIEPNSMQKKALESLRDMRSQGKRKALVIAAPGTGKTYLSAFDAKNFFDGRPGRLLFLVHREKILRAARDSYQKIFGSHVSMGLYTGEDKESGTFLFATVQTMYKHVLEFPHDEFDYIVYDEVHHLNPRGATGKKSKGYYETIIKHFRPKFMLGMTATPERTDGSEIFSTFDNNIALEVRMNQALSEGLLCPFHYFGISDLTMGDEKRKKVDFNRLIAEERIEHICRQIENFPHSGDRLRALMFCSKVEECKELSKRLNGRKVNGHTLRTLALSSKNKSDERSKAISRLESDGDDGLDIIITRDIFNEGIDIPRVNEVIFLRPTESVIVYAQQLGRGLRKAEDKEFLTVLDFIGNYDNNYLIPMALYGDNTRRSESVRRKMMMESIPGASTISFDEKSKEEILRTICSSRMVYKKPIKDDYKQLKDKLGHEPTLCELYREGSVDPRIIFEQFGNINNLRSECSFSYVVLNEKEDRMLSRLSEYVAEGQRPHEGVILKALVNEAMVQIPKLAQLILDEFGIEVSDESVESAIGVLCGEFDKKGSDNFEWAVAMRAGNAITRTTDFSKFLLDGRKRELVNDIIECSALIFRGEYQQSYDGYMSLGQRYSRKDACRLLNNSRNLQGFVTGYTVLDNDSSCPIFVIYNKDESFKGAKVRYDDRFINRKIFQWSTSYVSRKYLKDGRFSKDIDHEVSKILRADRIGMKLPLFVQKEKPYGGTSDGSDENKSNSEKYDYYYLGMTHPINGSDEVVDVQDDSGKTRSVLHIKLELEAPVEDGLYRYLTM